jgi:hypothetical protein
MRYVLAQITSYYRIGPINAILYPPEPFDGPRDPNSKQRMSRRFVSAASCTLGSFISNGKRLPPVSTKQITDA